MLQRYASGTVVLLLGAVAGGLLTAAWERDAWAPQARASATHGADNFAIATGLVDEGIEALYFLDFLTGDLRATIVNRRNGAFTGLFKHNVLADFEGVLDNPKFLMVTGLADLPRGAGPSQLGSSVIYIAEASSGQVNAYVLPFNRTIHAAGKPQIGGFLRIAGGSFRDAYVRDQAGP